ncbi:MAG TPA: DUF2269 family protein [Candidatus Limnocylindrales bacterium]|nr:DUF2269 family protein [Candidatus Limnocylindrales bacterium]
MSWYELLKTIHILSIATWFGSGLAILVIGVRVLASGARGYSNFIVNASWWAGRAHPGAGVLLLITGFAMVADADLSVGDTWIWLGILGLVVAMGLGGALIGRTADAIVDKVETTGFTDAQLPTVRQLNLYVRIELAILVLVIADMVAKPGL